MPICHTFSYGPRRGRYESNLIHKTRSYGLRNNIAKIGFPWWDTDIMLLVGTLLSEDCERKVLDGRRSNKIFIMLRLQIRKSRNRSDTRICFHLFTYCIIIRNSSEDLEKSICNFRMYEDLCKSLNNSESKLRSWPDSSVG